MDEPAVLRPLLQRWYAENRRSLPWRQRSDPYAIWVSEIMLQQTRVAAVIERYEAFLQRFPTVRALAEATDAEVLTAWSGLGYYRRARMLHRGAQEVSAKHGGKVPGSFAALLELPGIGRYTAAAIASIAFGEAVAAVDGNVERVVLRLSGIGANDAVAGVEGRRVQAGADQLLDRRAPGDWNQAMMELGATVCLPRGPRCEACPWVVACRTRGEHPTRKRAAMRTEELGYEWTVRKSARESSGRVLLVQRDERQSVMPSMWELPEAETAEGEPVLRLRHAIMQVNYQVAIYLGSPSAAKRSKRRGERWVTADDAGEMPLTGLTRKVMEGMGWLSVRRK